MEISKNYAVLPISEAVFPTSQEKLSGDDLLTDEAKKADENFKEVLARFDAAQPTEEEKRRMRAARKKEAEEKRDLLARIQKLYAEIARLRAKLGVIGDDPATQAELDAAETKLFWLQFGM